MTIPKTPLPAERWDSIDREAFAKMIESEQFKAILERIDAERVRQTNDCVNLVAHDDILRAQGAARALQSALKIPGMILDEIRRRSRIATS
jgi:hypothetical protein